MQGCRFSSRRAAVHLSPWTSSLLLLHTAGKETAVLRCPWSVYLFEVAISVPRLDQLEQHSEGVCSRWCRQLRRYAECQGAQ